MTPCCYLVFVGTVSDHNEIMGLCGTQGLLNNRCINKQDRSLFKQRDIKALTKRVKCVKNEEKQVL